MDTRAVVEHHLDALQRADLEATLDDYTDESLLLVAGSEPVRGREALAAVFGPAIDAMFAPPSSAFMLDSLVAVGEYALITWHMTYPGGEVSFGTDTFVVRDGKIVLHTGAIQL